MSTIDLNHHLDRLLSESMDSAIDREQRCLEEKIGSLDNELILFGAGNLGRKALRTLKRLGKTPVAFIDNNPVLWGTELDGVPIMSPAAAAKKFDPGLVGVITTIWCGEATDKMADRVQPLTALGFRNVALFGHLALKYQDEFLPHYCLDRPSKVIAQADKVRSAFSLLSDDESRTIFVNHIEWRLFLDYDLLPYPSPELIYFNNKFVNKFNTEMVYDIGAYTGDSIKSFLDTDRGLAFHQIHAFEPSPNNFLALQHYIEGLERFKGKIFAHQLALGDAIGTIHVEAEYGPASRVGTGGALVPMTTVDVFSASFGAPTFIKIDIEGFEPQCLLGARQVITTTAPVVAVCVYHLQSHIWDILLQLYSYYPDYSFHLCPHLADGWDLVLYAVPRNRRPV